MKETNPENETKSLARMESVGYIQITLETLNEEHYVDVVASRSLD